jgi:ABC-type glucose/galactose transport system permease subunit
MNKHLKIIVCLFVLFFVHCPYGGSAKNRCKIKYQSGDRSFCAFGFNLLETAQNDTELSTGDKASAVTFAQAVILECLKNYSRLEDCKNISEYELDLNPEPESPN